MTIRIIVGIWQLVILLACIMVDDFAVCTTLSIALYLLRWQTWVTSSTKLYCLVTGTRVCVSNLSRKLSGQESNMRPVY